MAVMIFRYADVADASAIAELYSANGRDALSEEQRLRQGFVQGNLDAGALAAMVGERELLVAEDAGRITGLLGLSAVPEIELASPPIRALIEAQDSLRWDDRPLSAVRWLMYGPIVVDAAYRGQGVARGLFGAALEAAIGRADVLVAFIEVGNQHSRRVHVDGLGMRPLGDVAAGERAYTIVATAV